VIARACSKRDVKVLAKAGRVPMSLQRVGDEPAVGEIRVSSMLWCLVTLLEEAYFLARE
jgi:hypothetical protein